MSDLFDRNVVLKEMLLDRKVVSKDGQIRPTGGTILPKYAEALYRMVLENKPAVVLEVGKARQRSRS